MYTLYLGLVELEKTVADHAAQLHGRVTHKDTTYEEYAAVTTNTQYGNSTVVMVPRRYGTHPGVFKDYSKLAIQYGYCVLFASAFPLAPVACAVANVVELRSHVFQVCRRFRRAEYASITEIGTCRQSSSNRQRCSGRQPACSPLAGPGGRFGPDCSRSAPGRPSGSGGAGAMSRVGEALRELAKWNKLVHGRRASTLDSGHCELAHRMLRARAIGVPARVSLIVGRGRRCLLLPATVSQRRRPWHTSSPQGSAGDVPRPQPQTCRPHQQQYRRCALAAWSPEPAAHAPRSGLPAAGPWRPRRASTLCEPVDLVPPSRIRVRQWPHNITAAFSAAATAVEVMGRARTTLPVSASSARSSRRWRQTPSAGGCECGTESSSRTSSEPTSILTSTSLWRCVCGLQFHADAEFAMPTTLTTQRPCASDDAHV